MFRSVHSLRVPVVLLALALLSACEAVAGYAPGAPASLPGPDLRDAFLADLGGGDAGDGTSDRSSGQCVEHMLTPRTPADIGEINGNDFHPDGELIASPIPGAFYIGYWQGLSSPTWLYLRLTLPFALDGQVRQARLSMLGAGTTPGWNPSVHALRVEIEDTADAAEVTGADRAPSNGGAKTLGKTVRWPSNGGLAWRTDALNTVELAPLLQQLADKYTLSTGDHIQLWIRGDFNGVDAEVITLPPVAGVKPPALALQMCP